MVIDNSYHPSSITVLNLDTVFNPQVMTFYLHLFTDGTMVELNTNQRSFTCSFPGATTDTQCGQVSLHGHRQKLLSLELDVSNTLGETVARDRHASILGCH